jgi:hypothetical protein
MKPGGGILLRAHKRGNQQKPLAGHFDLQVLAFCSARRICLIIVTEHFLLVTAFKVSPAPPIPFGKSQTPQGPQIAPALENKNA